MKILKKITFIIICAILIACLFYWISGKINPKKPPLPPQDSLYPQTRLYEDTGKYFSIRAPINWSVNENTAVNTTGLNTNLPKSQNVEIITFSVPARMGITIQIYQGAPSCPLTEKLTSSLAGLPASYSETLHRWIIPTADAVIAASIAYPGSGGYYGFANKSRFQNFPQSVAEADKKLVESVLTSLKINNPQPFTCPE